MENENDVIKKLTPDERRILAVAAGIISFLRDEGYTDETEKQTRKIAKDFHQFYVDALNYYDEMSINPKRSDRS